MENNLKSGMVNQMNAGSQILAQGDTVHTICLVLKGRVLIKSKGMQITLGSGSFLGICDLYTGVYQASYYAIDNIMLYAFSVSNLEELEKFLAGNKEYPGVVVASYSKSIGETYKIYSELLQAVKRLYTATSTVYQRYQNIAKASGFSIKTIHELENLDQINLNTLIPIDILNYYRACNGIQAPVQKAYYGVHKFIYMRHIKEQAEVLNQMLKEGSELANFVCKLYYTMISEDSNSLFYILSELESDLVSTTGIQNKEIMSMIDKLLDLINEIEILLEKKAGIKVEVSRERMEQVYFLLMSGKSAKENDKDIAIDEDVDIDSVKVLVRNTFQQIMDYGKVSEEVQVTFKTALDSFKQLRDKASSDDTARSIRRQIAKHYYVVYEAVFRKYLTDKEVPTIVLWFLDYGFLDETLLNEEQILSIASIKEDKVHEGPCEVYKIREWLEEVYKGNKEPSKNEFDLDYIGSLREQRKTNTITEEQLKEYEHDQDRKLSYEIENMFTYNNRIVSGQGTSFVPILHEANFSSNLERDLLDEKKINSVVNQLLLIDFSVFYRETVYSDEENGIKREFIQKQVFPEIILMPINGTNGSMWQDITGKVRTSSGRFLLPIIMETTLKDIMIQLFGRFRWELCRTIQGTTWNNIQYPSLTSEYSDYLQFYRKNRDLTEDKKEKLKAQIQRARGSSRETFVMDYLIWVRFESQGSIRLNKVAREILATYCPFSKELREKVASQPLFAEAMEKSERERKKKIKEIDLRRRAYEKDKVELPEEILETYTFYNEM